MTTITAMFERKPTPVAQILQYKEPVYLKEMVDSGSGNIQDKPEAPCSTESIHMLKKRKEED